MDLQSLIAPLIALTGTLVVATLGFHQWKKQNGDPNRGAKADAKRKAVETIWLQLEDINLRLRPFGEDSRKIDIGSELRQLNELFLRNSLYLDDALQSPLNEYVKQLHRAAKLIDKYQENTSEWASTAINPRSRVAKYKEVNEQLDLLEALRAKIKKSLHGAIDG